jgi:WD40 repeat protein
MEPLQVLYDTYHERRERRVLRGVEQAIALGARRVLVNSDNGVRVWNAEHGSLCPALPGPDGPAEGFRRLSDGRIAILSGNLPQIWQADATEPGPTLRGHEGRVVDVRRLRDGRLLTCSLDGTARLWDGRTGAPELVLRGHKGLVWAAEALGDERILTTGDDLTARVWDARTGTLVSVIGGAESPALGRAEPLSDGSVLTLGKDDGGVRIWKAETGALRSSLLQGGDLPGPPAPPANLDGHPAGIIVTKVVGRRGNARTVRASSPTAGF